MTHRLREAGGLGRAHAARPDRALPQQRFQEPAAEEDEGFGRFVGVDGGRLEPAEEEALEHPEGGEEQCLLLLEVRVDGPLRGSRAGGDDVHGGPLETDLQKHALRGPEDVLAERVAAPCRTGSIPHDFSIAKVYYTV